MIPARLKRHTFMIEPLRGNGSHGPSHGDPVNVAGYIVAKVQLVRSSDDQQVTSGSTAYTDLEVDAPVGSKVTWQQRTFVVVAVTRHDSAGRSRLDHQELALA